MNFNRIRVGSKTGAITGFVAYDDTQLFGLSAFHVLSGSDKIIDPSDEVEIRNEQTKRWCKLGRTFDRRYYYGRGTGIDDFGFLDYAFFEMRSSILSKVENNLHTIELHPLFYEKKYQELKNTKVFGYSVINKQIIAGQVKSVFCNVANNYFDVEISIEQGTSESGDSGMLWKDEYGNALFMHIRGNQSDYATTSYATFLNRIVGDAKLFEYNNHEAIT